LKANHGLGFSGTFSLRMLGQFIEMAESLSFETQSAAGIVKSELANGLKKLWNFVQQFSLTITVSIP
jgi:hypothetical protein